MTRREKKRIRERFFAAVGRNAEAFKQLFDCAPSLCFYMKDLKGRIMALNRRNCEVCNIKNEWDAIGLRSDEIFPEPLASDYMSLDREVLATGKPILGRITRYPADRSMNYMISDVFPLFDGDGAMIGTARAYRLSASIGDASMRYDRMQGIVRYINDNYRSDVPIGALAEVAGVSISGFKRAFAKAFHMPPGRYIETVRINHARKMLEETELPLSAVATACGFYDQSHLTRIFKRVRKQTPGEYRKSHFGE